MDVLLHGMMSLRDKPENEKQAWKALFDYYVFGDASRVTAHLPEPSHGRLARWMTPPPVVYGRCYYRI